PSLMSDGRILYRPFSTFFQKTPCPNVTSAIFEPGGTYSFRILGKTSSFVPVYAENTRSFVAAPRATRVVFFGLTGVALCAGIGLSLPFRRTVLNRFLQSLENPIVQRHSVINGRVLQLTMKLFWQLNRKRLRHLSELSKLSLLCPEDSWSTRDCSMSKDLILADSTISFGKRQCSDCAADVG